MEGNRNISSQILFNNKVAFPSLEEMSISYLRKMNMIWEDTLPPNSFPKLRDISIKELPNLKYIWKNDPKGIFSFKNLHRISVGDCWSLKNIFPASVARDLPQLSDLRIACCGVEEIVSKVEEGSDLETTVTFEFDQLSSLLLWRLPDCKCFYPGKHTTKWPMLKELTAYECGQMRIFGTQLITHHEQLDFPPPLFLVEKVIPKLCRLTLGDNYIAMIARSNFHEIKAFGVIGHGYKSVHDSQNSFLERFYNLEELCISNCEIKGLFCTQGDTGNKGTYARTLSTIKTIKLRCLQNLKDHLWKLDLQVDHILPNLETLEVYECDNLISLGSSSASFQNLTTLDVWECREMKYLDTCVAVQGLCQLKKLIIRACISVKEIVGSEEDVETCDIIFSRLKSLELVNLPRLKSFCSGNHTFGFPCLEEVIVSGCPELERFCKGVLNVPLLQSVEYGNGKRHWSGDLDSTVQQLHSIKAGYQGIGYLVLSEFAKSIETWKENVQGSLDFKNLTVLEVEECNNLKYLFSVSMALELVQLTDLKVKNCPMIEQIIKTGAEETTIDTLPLPKLKMIKLESCSELTSFCMGSITLQCPSLIRIEVDNCPKMYAMATPMEVGSEENTAFFNDKVLCANLQLAHLSSTNIQKLWPDKPHTAIPSNVQNLRILTVRGCHNLEYLFPSFLIEDFVRLTDLSLYDCENMEQVIFTEEEGITKTYLFTRLQLLHLIRLPKLGTFCHGDNSVTDDPALFNEKVWFPSLNHLILVELGNCRKIWHDKVTMGSFYELIYLGVEDCERLLNILPFGMVERLEKLQTLRIWRCGSLEEIIGPGDEDRLNPNESHEATSTESVELKSTNIKFLFPKIRELNLEMLPKLKGFYSKVHTTEWLSLKKLEVTECSKVETLAREYVNFGETQGESQPLLSVQQPLFWVTEEILQVMECEKLMNPVPTSVSFKHLTTLKVSKCHGFRNLVTFTIAKSMVQLKTMSVTDCQMIEEIIASTTDGVTDVIVFGQLESLELDSLPCLSRFFSGNYALVFPKLEEVIIGQCQKLEFFTMGELWTPMLHGLQSTKGRYEGRWEGDLNATIQQFFIEKVFPSSEDLELSSINIQRAWNHKLLATRSYARNLTCLTIEGCHNLNCLFSPSMVESFVQLKKLNIENCENVENLIIVEESDKEEMNWKLFRLLEFLVLKDLPKLTRFCHGNYFEFPLLTSLRIESCPRLKTFVSGAQGITAEIASPALFNGKELN